MGVRGDSYVLREDTAPLQAFEPRRAETASTALERWLRLLRVRGGALDRSEHGRGESRVGSRASVTRR